MTKETPNFNPNHTEEFIEPSVQFERVLGQAALEEVLNSQAKFEGYNILALDNEEETKQLHRYYIQRTAQLIEKTINNDSDNVIFLDKSARPVAWFYKKLWPHLAPRYSSEENPVMPTINFLNIDRLHWRGEVGGSEIGEGTIDFSGVDDEAFKELRDIFEDPVTKKNRLDSRNITVVDEVEFTGDTLRIAKSILDKTFKDVSVAPHAWTTSKRAKDSPVPKVPMWYSESTERGRGVGDRSADASLRSKSTNQRRGWRFLSTRFNRPDPLSRELRLEIDQVVEDFTEGKLGITPSDL